MEINVSYTRSNVSKVTRERGSPLHRSPQRTRGANVYMEMSAIKLTSILRHAETCRLLDLIWHLIYYFVICCLRAGDSCALAARTRYQRIARVAKTLVL
jgi:hypothetical protein